MENARKGSIVSRANSIGSTSASSVPNTGRPVGFVLCDRGSFCSLWCPARSGASSSHPCAEGASAAAALAGWAGFPPLGGRVVGNSVGVLQFPAVLGVGNRSGFGAFPRELQASSSCPAPQGKGGGWQGRLERLSLARPAGADCRPGGTGLSWARLQPAGPSWYLELSPAPCASAPRASGAHQSGFFTLRRVLSTQMMRTAIITRSPTRSRTRTGAGGRTPRRSRRGETPSR